MKSREELTHMIPYCKHNCLLKLELLIDPRILWAGIPIDAHYARTSLVMYLFDMSKRRKINRVPTGLKENQ